VYKKSSPVRWRYAEFIATNVCEHERAESFILVLSHLKGVFSGNVRDIHERAMPAKFGLACSVHDTAHVHDLRVNIRGRFSRPPGLTGLPVLESIPDSKVVTGTRRTP
jgi:hypothetical protein